MKIQYLKHYLLIFCINLAIGIGCTTQNTTNPIDPTENFEVVLENHQLTENETWTPEKTYTVKGTLEIPRDVTLNIPPGTTVKFGRNALLTVRGILKVGTPLAEEQVTQLVHLTSENIRPGPADWKGILFDHTHDLESFIRGAVIAYATTALDIKTTSPTVAECILRHNATAIAIDGSDAQIQHTDILHNTTGIRTLGRQTRPQIHKNTITQNEIGIHCENVQSLIRDNNLNANIFALRLNVKFNLSVPHNWWGHTDATEIATVLIDANDPELIPKQVGTVTYQPFTAERIPDAGFPYPTLLTGL